MKTLWCTIFDWLENRFPIGAATEVIQHKTVPIHRYSICYYFGGVTLFFFLIQVVTGILLMLYYRPSANEAFESVEFIMTTVPFGWLIRSIHSWSANLMIFFAFVHLITAYFMKAYRTPREITWVTGSLLLFIGMAFGFSGYLLPWNQLAFFATNVGTDIASSIPLIGDYIVRFLRGGDRVTGGTLSRFYGWHVAILPAITTAVLGIHLFLVQLQGMSVPPGQKKASEKRSPMKFFPNFLLRDLFAWTVALALLATLAALFPWELGEKADPFAPAYKDIKPEWYFMFMFETLKVFPGGEILGVELEAIPILLFGVAGFLLPLVPFIDRKSIKLERSPIFTILGVGAMAYIVGMTAWGYRSMIPIYISVVVGLVIYFHGAGVGKGKKGGEE
jgi:cytochrome b6